jgi:hypothetical protein
MKKGFTWLLICITFVLGLFACSKSVSINTNGAANTFSRASIVTTLAGTSESSGTTDGIGAAARFHDPEAITTDGTNLYVADTENFTVREIVIATRQVATLAGTIGLYGSADGIGADAQFYDVAGISTDGTNLYVADTSNCTIRQIVIATGQVSTLAGATSYLGNSLWGPCSSTDGIGATARFNNPQGLATDGINLYVADTWSHIIRKIVLSTGEVSTLAGSTGLTGMADGIGAAARFNNPQGIATDGTNLYVADSHNYTLRKIAIATREVTTLAGFPGSWGFTDGIGDAARFGVPRGVTTDGTYLYVTDSGNQTIRKMTIATREVITIAGTPGSPITSSVDGTGATATFGYPLGITIDESSLYITDSSVNTIRRIQ